MRGQIAALEQQVCERDRDLRELRTEVELRGIESTRCLPPMADAVAAC
jgi:hypothetical protein